LTYWWVAAKSFRLSEYKNFSKHFKFPGHMNMTGRVFPAGLTALKNRSVAQLLQIRLNKDGADAEKR